MQRSFKQRMAELERLEGEADQGRQLLIDHGIPDLATMSDDEVLWEAIVQNRLHPWHLRIELWPGGQPTFAPATRLNGHGQVEGPLCAACCWERFYADLAVRAQPLLDACPRPVILLASWEIEDAIALIDAGRVAMNRTSLQLVGEDEDAALTITAVNGAHSLVERQIYYPQPGSFGKSDLTTIEAWRAWLVGLLERHSGGTL